MERIVIVGAGVVGAATGEGFRRRGHDVTLIDTNPTRVAELERLGYDAHTELDLSGPSAFVFLALPTPAIEGKGYDLSAFFAGVEEVGEALRSKRVRAHHTIVVRSTVPPRTLDRIVVPKLEATSGRKVERDFSVASAPEFLRAATAVEDFLKPWMTVLASHDRPALDRLVELFAPFGGELRTFDNPVIAECIKITHNVFNATKISFWNEMWRLCQELEIETDYVSSAVAHSAEGSFNPDYGIHGGAPYGGACLPKDTEGLLGFARSEGVDLPLVRSVQEVNHTIESLTSIPPTDIDGAVTEFSELNANSRVRTHASSSGSGAS
ncbi:MAG TPA: NAD(P)-binding domain-containing protein [Acidimicrobiales bacterium]|nr:NAD(P)-binding domain-containing protein [Acidimicrobiales bacterium]